jgi:hypothetical protein
VESLLTAPPHLLNTYRVGGTPGAVLVATDGTIDTAPATGAPTIEALVRIALRRAGAAPPPPAPVTLQVSRG